MSTPTGLHLNWTGVKHGTTNIKNVSNVQFDPGGDLLPYAGDNSRYPTALVNAMNRPGASVECEDMATLSSFNIGDEGSFVAILNDAKNLAVTGGGALQFTLSNAVIRNVPLGGQFGQFGRGQLQMLAYSADGVTPPLAVQAL